jgi:exodeoxyribonuclease III
LKFLIQNKIRILTKGVMKILCWNVAGIRASIKKGALDFLQAGEYDIVCFQETKAQPIQVKIPDEITSMYPNRFWHSNPGTTQRAGFSGTCIWTKADINASNPIIQLPPPAFDTEGRTTSLEFDNFILITVYTPNSQEPGALRCQYRVKMWDLEMRKYMRDLNKIKPTIICGDFNVAHQDKDLYNAKKYYNACVGFLNSERENFSAHLEAGFLDAFRINNNNSEQYTYWNQRVPTMRKTNRGWRIDYFLVPEQMREQIKSCEIHPEIMGSDHCPISLEIK